MCFLIGSKNTPIKNSKDKEKYTNCLLANVSLVSLIKWYDNSINVK